MRLFGTFMVVILLIGLLTLFVWGWFAQDKPIPEAVFAALLGVIATVTGYVWIRDRHKPH
jgi:membrane associated rhomboid family serine protease